MIEYETADGLKAIEGPQPHPRTPYLYRPCHRTLKAASFETCVVPMPMDIDKRTYRYAGKEEREIFGREQLVYHYVEEL